MSSVLDPCAAIRAVPPSSALGSAALWSTLARGVGLAPEAPVVLGLSGGADSVYLLHVLAEARPRPRVFAIHVDHGLRGDEGRADLEFCAQLAERLGVDFASRKLTLDPHASSLEARARRARYAELCAHCERVSCRTLLTAHHRDDAVETMILRWLRGTDLLGLHGLRPRVSLPPSRPRAAPGSPIELDLDTHTLNPTGVAIELLRPLLHFEHDELCCALTDRGLAWREDSTNCSPRFSRNRVRNALLPWLAMHTGTAALQTFVSLDRQLAEFDTQCASLTPEVASTSKQTYAIERSVLADLAPILRRRWIWQSVVQHTGLAPTRLALDAVEDALLNGTAAQENLRGGWTVSLNRRALTLTKLQSSTAPGSRAPTSTIPLDVPGAVDLGDGRVLCAAWIERVPGDEISASSSTALLDARDLAVVRVATEAIITIRRPLAGDRFRALGAPGSKPLTRFLRDAGVPAEERSNVPLVLIGNDIAWVAGVRPSHARRVREDSRTCLRLTLSDRAGDSGHPRG